MSARPDVSPAATPEKRGSAAAVPLPRRVQNSCYENLIDGMCCQLPGKISRPPLTKRKKGKEQDSSWRPGCVGSRGSAVCQKKDSRGTVPYGRGELSGKHRETVFPFPSPGKFPPWRTSGTVLLRLAPGSSPADREKTRKIHRQEPRFRQHAVTPLNPGSPPETPPASPVIRTVRGLRYPR